MYTKYEGLQADIRNRLQWAQYSSTSTLEVKKFRETVDDEPLIGKYMVGPDFIIGQAFVPRYQFRPVQRIIPAKALAYFIQSGEAEEKSQLWLPRFYNREPYIRSIVETRGDSIGRGWAELGAAITNFSGYGDYSEESNRLYEIAAQRVESLRALATAQTATAT